MKIKPIFLPASNQRGVAMLLSMHHRNALSPPNIKFQIYFTILCSYCYTKVYYEGLSVLNLGSNIWKMIPSGITEKDFLFEYLKKNIESCKLLR